MREGPTAPAPAEAGLPLLGWARGYDRAAFRQDLVAGLTVAVMLVPQSMAYALLAGVPPIYGLYASLVPLLVYAALGTSMHVAVGIVAIDMLIVHAGLAGMAEEFSTRWVELAILLAAMVGLVQLLMGVARLGFLVNLLSRPTVVGFTSGAAILIALSQVGGLTGMEIERARTLPGLVETVTGEVGEIRAIPVLLGAGSLVLMLGLRRWKASFPAVLAVVVGATAAVALLDLSGRVEVVGQVPHGLPAPGAPSFSLDAVRALAPSALALAFVQFLTVVSLGKVLAARHRYHIEPNRELLAVGAANVLGSLFQALPVSGSFSRSSLNEESGACTPAANAVAAAGVALALVALTPVLRLVPIPPLAAIIVVAALGLLDVEQIGFLWRAKSVDGGVAVLTLVATLAFGILWGIAAGVGASLFGLLYRISRPHHATLGHLAGTRSFRDIQRHDDARPLEGILILRVDASFSFMNAEYVRDLILGRTEDPDDPVRVVVVDASSINDLDLTAIDVLFRVERTLEERGIELYFGGVKEPVLETLQRSGFYEELGPDHFFLSPHRAITHVLTAWGVSETYLQNVPGAASPVALAREEPEG